MHLIYEIQPLSPNAAQHEVHPRLYSRAHRRNHRRAGRCLLRDGDPQRLSAACPCSDPGTCASSVRTSGYPSRQSGVELLLQRDHEESMLRSLPGQLMVTRLVNLTTTEEASQGVSIPPSCVPSPGHFCPVGDA